MDIIRQQQDDNPAVWHFKIGGFAGDGLYRLADLSRETTSPADWLAANQVEAQAAIDGGVFNEEHDLQRRAGIAVVDFRNLPGWASWTGQQAADYINGQILSGMTPDQVEAWVRANVTSFDKAVTGFILVGRELAELRAVCEQMARAIMYLRDVAIR